MGLFRNLFILGLIFVLVLLGLRMVLPIIAWAFELVFTLIALAFIGVAIVFLLRRLRI